MRNRGRVEVRVTDESVLTVRIRGLNRVWAMRGTVSTPLSAVTSVDVVPRPKDFVPWLRALGTSVPGLLMAGSFRGGGRRVFAVAAPRTPAIRLQLRDADYDDIVLQVDDPDATADTIREAIAIPTAP